MSDLGTFRTIAWYLLYLSSAAGLIFTFRATRVGADPVSLPQKTFQVDIAGKRYPIVAYPKLDTATQNDRLRIATEVDLDLQDAQSGLADALDATWKTDKCGDDLRTNNSIVRPQGEGLQIEADVHYVMWMCALGVRTHAATADGRVCMMSAPDGVLTVDGQLDCFDVSPVFFGAVKASTVKDLSRDEANRKLKNFVDKINDLLGPGQRMHTDGLKIDRAFFYDFNNGQLGAKVSASALMTGAQFADFLNTVSQLK